MKYELSLLEEIIYMQLLGRLTATESPDLEKWSEEIKKETIRIERALISFVFLNSSEQARKRYIQHHQRRLLYLVNVLQTCRDSKIFGNMDGKEHHYAFAEAQLKVLLDMIASHFERDILLDVPAARLQQQEIVELLQEKIILLKNILLRFEIDKTLSEMLIESFNYFMKQSTIKSYTYGQLFMMRDITKVIIERGNNNLPGSFMDTKWIVKQLCMLNFNRLSFYKFCRTWIRLHYPDADDEFYRYIRLTKFFKRIPVKASYGWDTQRMDINEMLSDYFKDIALVVKRKQRQQLLYHSNGEGQQNNERKLPTNLTVDQLGLFMRLIKEAGILKAGSISSIIRFCMHHISTIGKNPAEELSYEYLKSSISKTTGDAVDKVENHLQNMITHLRKIRVEARKTAATRNKA